MMPLARSNAEAHLFMDLRPCGCGDTRFPRQSAVVRRGDDLCSQYTGACETCGTVRTFVFRLPQEILMPVPGRVVFGGPADGPSQLLDAGEWLEVADLHARRNPGTVNDLATAIAATEEILKFVPPGGERVPDEAFWTERGRAVRDGEPGRFRAVRLEAVLGAYRDLLARRAP